MVAVKAGGGRSVAAIQLLTWGKFSFSFISYHCHFLASAQVLCLGPGLGAEVAMTDLFFYQVFHTVMHL